MVDHSPSGTAGETRPDVVDALREVSLTGVAVLVPAVICAYVLAVVFGVIHQFLQPVAAYVFPESEFVGTLVALVTFVGVVLGVGFVAHFRTGLRAINYVDAAIGRVPGVGTLYRSFRRMSDVMIESDADHFRAVSLVAFPHEHSYTLAFETAPTPTEIADPVGEGEMVTLFVPMSPNPVMGGFVVHVPRDRVYELDLSVEEGIRAVVTSGVTMDDRVDDPETFDAPLWELPNVSDVREIDVDALDHLDASELRELEAAVGERLLDVASSGTDEDTEDDR